ncbi:pyridoxamine 5'-phosphate oxidase family protein [Halalkalicoccus jeotgali]|uniref:Pyridoxamine 5'-phosphate oxidase-related FMN-binding protein n=1 Tax=Halalkalicoccus jeotgali (strain DSM 18796 / CECT 7217 / JCM 14584 / KCTC 4019 / B3) TaxID=795797 RepID=D8JCD5_HALJB|nr:pyridoxamine 5'-phosphate oxidase family protein [Halalkalicoccus jeotgali]ADJ17042.1 pyridoxamine 5'-phosphate oxidase-related FMN-binding protein [Halalkalicoccus jeotgali B3]ELY38795.1 pyridoxamine 5'-phosphate oxidase-related FMN-binding protein [Halalkalicoccus jeotgali B3]
MDKSAPEDVSDSIRYQGKAVNDLEWILQFLSDQETGVLGLIDDNSPHLVTQLFVYDDDKGVIFMHGAQDGRAYSLVENGDRLRASFTTSEKGRYIPADEPVNFTVEYSSVVAYGTIDLLTGEAEKQRVLERFMAKFAPQLTKGEDYKEMTEESIGRTAVYRLDVESWSGKKGWKDPDTPGAYDLEEVSKPG